jgi:hypothetical protein
VPVSNLIGKNMKLGLLLGHISEENSLREGTPNAL